MEKKKLLSMLLLSTVILGQVVPVGAQTKDNTSEPETELVTETADTEKSKQTEASATQVNKSSANLTQITEKSLKPANTQTINGINFSVNGSSLIIHGGQMSSLITIEQIWAAYGFNQPLTTINFQGTLTGVSNMSGFFANLSEVRDIQNIELLNLAPTRRFNEMFANTLSLEHLDISNWTFADNFDHAERMFQNTGLISLSLPIFGRLDPPVFPLRPGFAATRDFLSGASRLERLTWPRGMRLVPIIHWNNLTHLHPFIPASISVFGNSDLWQNTQTGDVIRGLGRNQVGGDTWQRIPWARPIETGFMMTYNGESRYTIPMSKLFELNVEPSEIDYISSTSLSVSGPTLAGITVYTSDGSPLPAGVHEINLTINGDTFTSTLTVAPAQLGVEPGEVVRRPFNGTNRANITSPPKITGLVGQDRAELTGATINFASHQAGTTALAGDDWEVAFTGDIGHNYVLPKSLAVNDLFKTDGITQAEGAVLEMKADYDITHDSLQVSAGLDEDNNALVFEHQEEILDGLIFQLYEENPELVRNQPQPVQTSKTGHFEGLKPESKYYVRALSNSTNFASGQSPVKAVTTTEAPASEINLFAPSLAQATSSSLTIHASKVENLPEDSHVEYALRPAGTSADFADWQQELVFENLAAETTYEIVARVSGTNVKSDRLEARTLAADSEAPAIKLSAPTLNQVTENMILIHASSVENLPKNSQVEYAIRLAGATTGFTGWQTQLRFENLSPNTSYEIMARVSGTAVVSESLKVRTLADTPIARTGNLPKVGEVAAASATLLGLGAFATALGIKKKTKK